MVSSKDQRIAILYSRYYYAALFMRNVHRQHFNDPTERELLLNNKLGPLIFFSTKSGAAMAVWHGMLYVVIEGWLECKLSDPEVDRLLTSPNVRLLRRFRNGMFHFQGAEWLSAKMGDFCGSPDSVRWVDALMKAFGRYFVNEMQRINAK